MLDEPSHEDLVFARAVLREVPGADQLFEFERDRRHDEESEPSEDESDWLDCAWRTVLLENNDIAVSLIHYVTGDQLIHEQPSNGDTRYVLGGRRAVSLLPRASIGA